MEILLITHSFYPADVIGAKRWTDFYNLSLDDHDINFTVLTANWIGEKIISSNIYYLGKELKVKRIPSYQKNNGIFDLFTHPSLFIRSINKSTFYSWIKNCKNWVDQNNQKKFDLIISSYSPLTSIIVGNYAKDVFKVPYIVDLRDLISIQGQKRKFPVIHQIDKLIDKFLTRKVTQFITVSPTCFKKAIFFYGKDVSLIYNGFTNQLKLENKNLSIENPLDIRILYMGTLGNNRSPKKIIQILNQYSIENPSIKISLSFASKDNPFDFLINTNDSSIQIRWLGFLTKKELLNEKNKSNIFLLLEDQTSNGNENLTGKLYEYFEEQKPILVSCHNESDIVKIVNETNTGSLVNTVSELENFILNKRIRNNNECLKYSRQNQYLKLKKTLSFFLKKESKIE